MRAPVRLAAILVFLTGGPSQAQVFADFETKLGVTAFGNFTVQLDHTWSPFTVASFIRLAEGSLSWPDPDDGTVRNGPFYEGLEFYDVEDNWEIACGSPGNDGTGGPGYTFQDDFRSADLPQNTPQFAIYMDSTGPNTNGSRFFINLTAGLNPDRLATGRRYTRFGVVLTQTNPPGGNGRVVVNAISNSAPGFITISKITIRYVGADAQSFRTALQDPNHIYLSDLPVFGPAALRFRRGPDSLFLDWDDTPGSIVQMYSSYNLQTWIGPAAAMNVPGGTTFGIDLTASLEFADTAFFRGGATRYSEWPSTERPLARSIIQTQFFDPAVGASFTSAYSFDVSGTAGTYASAFGGGAFQVTRNEVLGPYSSRLELTPTSGSQPTYRFVLHYDLAWSSQIPSLARPAIANPCRLNGENLANPGHPLQGGQWTYSAP